MTRGAGWDRPCNVSSLDLDVAEFPRSGASTAGPRARATLSSPVILLLRLPTLVNGDEVSLCPGAVCENSELSASVSVVVEGVTISGLRLLRNGNPAAGVMGAASVEGVVIREVGRERFERSRSRSRSRSGEVLPTGIGRGPRTETEFDLPDLIDWSRERVWVRPGERG